MVTQPDHRRVVVARRPLSPLGLPGSGGRTGGCTPLAFRHLGARWFAGGRGALTRMCVGLPRPAFAPRRVWPGRF